MAKKKDTNRWLYETHDLFESLKQDEKKANHGQKESYETFTGLAMDFSQD